MVAVYAEKLTARGHDVEIVCSRPSRPLLRKRIKSFLREFKWPKHPIVGASHNAEYNVKFRVVEHTGPLDDRDIRDGDIVVATFWSTAHWAVTMSSAKGRQVYLVQGDEGKCFPAHPGAESSYQLPILNICVSQWIANSIRSRHPRVRQTVIRNAVESDRFQKPHTATARGPHIGFAFSTAGFKGADIAIAALKLAFDQVSDLTVETLASKRPSGLPTWIQPCIQPKPDELSGLYGRCRAWLFPSRMEGFGLPILEAMACGTPVIGTPSGAAPELIGQGGGLLVPHNDPQAMADAIFRVCRMSEPDWQVLSDAAYHTATSYSWDDATDLLEKTFLAEIARTQP